MKERTLRQLLHGVGYDTFRAPTKHSWNELVCSICGHAGQCAGPQSPLWKRAWHYAWTGAGGGCFGRGQRYQGVLGWVRWRGGHTTHGIYLRVRASPVALDDGLRDSPRWEIRLDAGGGLWTWATGWVLSRGGGWGIHLEFTLVFLRFPLRCR